jgi:hypothetical protein
LEHVAHDQDAPKVGLSAADLFGGGDPRLPQ